MQWPMFGCSECPPTQNIREVAITPPKTEKKRVSRGARVTPALTLFKAFESELDCVSDSGLLESPDVVLFTAGVADGAGRAGGETVCKVGGLYNIEVNIM